MRKKTPDFIQQSHTHTHTILLTLLLGHFQSSVRYILPVQVLVYPAAGETRAVEVQQLRLQLLTTNSKHHPGLHRQSALGCVTQSSRRTANQGCRATSPCSRGTGSTGTKKIRLCTPEKRVSILASTSLQLREYKKKPF